MSDIVRLGLKGRTPRYSNLERWHRESVKGGEWVNTLGSPGPFHPRVNEQMLEKASVLGHQSLYPVLCGPCPRPGAVRTLGLEDNLAYGDFFASPTPS